MRLEEVQALVDSSVDLIAVSAEGLAESAIRAGKFLEVQAILTTYLREVDEHMAKLTTLRDATYATVLNKAEGKNVTEKKINTEKEESYAQIRQDLEMQLALHEWVKGHIKIFENAHILYRSLSREGG